MFCEWSEFGDLEQVLRDFRQQAEAVDEFDFEFVQFCGGFGAGDAFVRLLMAVLASNVTLFLLIDLSVRQ